MIPNIPSGKSFRDDIPQTMKITFHDFSKTVHIIGSQKATVTDNDIMLTLLKDGLNLRVLGVGDRFIPDIYLVFIRTKINNFIRK